VCRHNDLNPAAGFPCDGGALGGLVRLQQQKIEHEHLKLRVQMRLRLFDEEQRQVRVPCFRKLHDDGCDVKKIGVAQAGRNNVFERDAGVSQLETKVTGDVVQRLGSEVEGCGLGANACVRSRSASLICALTSVARRVEATCPQRYPAAHFDLKMASVSF
jgi:hypothetical protein